MSGNLFILTGSISVIVWGLAHLIPTKSIVRNFGDITKDNKRIITMEWIIEGLSLIFIGTLLLLVTYLGEKGDTIRNIVYIASAAMLMLLAIVSLFTGARNKFIAFKLCPFIFTFSAVMILLHVYLVHT